ncbi:MAG TPA: DUF892 family protein [Planctomycetota bacterium]|nr:DUF892 family protein [Planctomycetota bacterium]
MRIRNLNDVLARELRELLGAECHVYDGMKKLCKRVTDPELLQLLRHHRRETDLHIHRLKKILADVGVKPKALQSNAVTGMFRDVAQMLKRNDLNEHLADIYVLGSAMKIIGFEINSCETVLPAVRELGLNELHVADQLEEIVNADKAALSTLQRLGQRLLREEVAFPAPEPVSETANAAEDAPAEPGHDEFYNDAHQPHYDFDDFEDDIPEEGALPDERSHPEPARGQG